MYSERAGRPAGAKAAVCCAKANSSTLLWGLQAKRTAEEALRRAQGEATAARQHAEKLASDVHAAFWEALDRLEDAAAAALEKARLPPDMTTCMCRLCLDMKSACDIRCLQKTLAKGYSVLSAVPSQQCLHWNTARGASHYVRSGTQGVHHHDDRMQTRSCMPCLDVAKLSLAMPRHGMHAHVCMRCARW